MAQDFLKGLLEGLTPQVQEAVKLRVAQKVEEDKRQKDFADSINKIFIGEQAKAQFREPSQLEQLQEGLKMVGQGKIDETALKEQFPTRIGTIEKALPYFTPVEKSPEFRAGTGTPMSHLISKFSGSQAELNPKTLNIINQIKTKADLNELEERREEAEKEGIDVDAILEYFKE